MRRRPKLYKLNVNEWKLLWFCFVCYMLFVNCFEFLLCFVLDLLVFYSALVLCFFLFDFASRSCLWPLLLFQLSFCKSRFSSLALVFGSCLTFGSYFYFSFFVYGFNLAFASCFCFSFFAFGSCQVLISHFYLSLFVYGWKNTMVDQKWQMWCS